MEPLVEKRSRSRKRTKVCGNQGSKRTRRQPKFTAQDIPHFQWERGQRLGPEGRYYVRKFLGEGTFGRVLSCKDAKTRENVAVKVVKGVKRYSQHAKEETEILREVSRCDPGRQSHCVQLIDTFVHSKRNFCMVFEFLDASIRDYMKINEEVGLPMADVRSISEQLAQCLCYLHAVNIMHTDIKCRNVLLRDSRHEIVPLARSREGASTRKLKNCDIVMIDFGAALHVNARGRHIISTRQYRAPEVVLSLPWEEKADLWSAGCLIAMTYLGRRPFGMREDLEHLALIEKFLGMPIPEPMVRSAVSEGRLPQGVAFVKEKLDWPSSAVQEGSTKRVNDLAPLRDSVEPQHGPLVEMLEGMLQIDPSKRLSAQTVSMLPMIVGNKLPE